MAKPAKKKAPAKKGAAKKTPAKKAAPAKSAAKKAPAKSEASGAKRGGPAKYSNDAVITLVEKTNPKREGSKAHTAYALYKTGMTVGEFKEAGGRPGDINWDVDKGYIKVKEVAKKKAA